MLNGGNKVVAQLKKHQMMTAVAMSTRKQMLFLLAVMWGAEKCLCCAYWGFIGFSSVCISYCHRFLGSTIFPVRSLIHLVANPSTFPQTHKKHVLPFRKGPVIYNDTAGLLVWIADAAVSKEFKSSSRKEKVENAGIGHQRDPNDLWALVQGYAGRGGTPVGLSAQGQSCVENP